MDKCKSEKQKSRIATQKNWPSILAIFIVLAALFMYSSLSSKTKKVQIEPRRSSGSVKVDVQKCFKTCSVEIVESIPQNISFNGFIPRTTLQAWSELISKAHSSLFIAAYKSSLRGKHVFGNISQSFSVEGEMVYNFIKNAAINRKLEIKMVENGGLSKDKGDNEDGIALNNKGILSRRALNLKSLFKSGTMHSKFLIGDYSDFYLGSANLDWRSLNQKMELGISVSNCACLTQDLTNIFNNYWHSSNAETPERYHEIQRHQPEALYNMQNPLIIADSGVNTEIYLAASPKTKENPSRTWDLDAVIHEISGASKYLYIHVMDYIPLFIYSQNKKFWPVIDNAIRAAILRKVEVKIIVAALHYPEISLRFLKSLESLKGINNATRIEVRVFKVPTSSKIHSVMKRERRTHNKFMVTENAVIIGTSNWSGDYFEGKSTGVAAVIKQKYNSKQPLIKTMKSIFLRDWNSNYTHILENYVLKCVENHTGDFCESEKDLSFSVS